MMRSRLRAHVIWFIAIAGAGCASHPYHEDDSLDRVLLGSDTKLQGAGSARAVAVGHWRDSGKRLSFGTDSEGRADDLLELRDPEGELVLQLLFSHGRLLASWSRWDAEHGSLTATESDAQSVAHVVGE